MKPQNSFKIWFENNWLTVIYVVAFIIGGAIFIHPVVLFFIPIFIFAEMWYFQKRRNEHLKRKYDELLAKVNKLKNKL